MNSYVRNTTLKNIIALVALMAGGYFSNDVAWAQDSKTIAKCVGTDTKESAAVSISACTALIRSYNFPIYYQERGNAYVLLGEYDRAIADYSEGIRLHRKNDGHEDFFYSRARAYLAKKDYNRAIADYSEAIRACGDCATAEYYYSDRARVFLITKNLDRAIADYSEAIRISPHDTEYYQGRADVYVQKNDNNRAIADLTEAIRIYPNYYALYLSRGKAQENLRDLRKAIVDFRTAFNFVKNDPGESNRRTESAENLKRVEQKLSGASNNNLSVPAPNDSVRKQDQNSKSLDCNDLSSIRTTDDFYFCAKKPDAKGGASGAPAGASPTPNQKSAALTEDPFITKAKAAVKARINDPESARFQSVELRTVAGKIVACGVVDGKNSSTGRMDTHSFAFDGEQTYYKFAIAESKNAATGSYAEIIDAYFKENTTAYNRLCK